MAAIKRTAERLLLMGEQRPVLGDAGQCRMHKLLLSQRRERGPLTKAAREGHVRALGQRRVLERRGPEHVARLFGQAWVGDRERRELVTAELLDDLSCELDRIQ